MYESLIQRLAAHQSASLLGLFFSQYLMVVCGPALIILGFGIWNPIALILGLLSLRLLIFLIDLQDDVIKQIARNERKHRFFN
jgi:hypothetical protein